MKFPDQIHKDLNLFINDYSKSINTSFNQISKSQISNVISVIEKAIKNKKIIFTCGNGGSSAIAEHFICDLTKGSSNDSKVQPKSISLSSNMSLFSAIANDIGYESVFAYQLEKYANKNDVLLVISSSGNSANIVNAIKKAKLLKMKTICFVGFSGGKAKKISDYSIHVNFDNYGIVEDVHQSLMHMISQYIRLKNFKNKKQISKKFF